jgi:hypothetical protein
MIEEPRREPPCLSDLKLDQLLSGELSGEAERRARAHLAECGACEGRRLSLAADRALFVENAPDFKQLTIRQRPRRLQRVALALSLAAALLVGVGLERLGRDGELGEHATSLETRTKGGAPVLGFVVRRAGESFWGEPGQVLHPGDELRFTVSSARASYCGVWGIDALGRASAYHGDGELSKVEAGTRQPLPSAVRLDDSLGEERLVGVFCSTRVPAAELSSAIAASPGAPSLPGECTHESFDVVKALP